jgi:hypothetical protein
MRRNLEIIMVSFVKAQVLSGQDMTDGMPSQKYAALFSY